MREYFNPAIGRWFVQLADGSWDYRYRVVMAQHLGRPLRTDEHVHHVNRIKTDDRLENLEIKTPAEHQALHVEDHQAGRKAKWLHEWSPKHAACTECGTTERQHVGKGQCSRCYYRLRKRITGGHAPRPAAEVVVATCARCAQTFSRPAWRPTPTYCSRSCALADKAKRQTEIAARQTSGAAA